MNPGSQSPQLLSTGIAGLDTILGGGLTPNRIYLLEGEPGTGKTTAGLQFILEGVRHGEPVVYVTLSETAEELRAVARSHGWNMDGVPIHEVLPSENLLQADQQYTVFHPAEVEMAGTTEKILAVIESNKPVRVVLDSLSEFQLLADTPLRYRRQVLGLKQFFSKRQCTVMLLDDRTAETNDLQIRSVANAVIQLEQVLKGYGAERRRVRVIKYRGRDLISGMHDCTIARGGMTVYPRLIASSTRENRKRAQFKTGLEALDKLLGGGIEEGSSTMIVGPLGTGKSSLATQFVHAATQGGGRAAMFLYEESASNMLNRADGLGMYLSAAEANGSLSIQQIDPAELSPGQFSAAVCKAAVEGAKVVVIDSLNGYMNSVPDERFLITHLHELLTFLAQRGVVTILVGVQQGTLAGTATTSLGTSYLVDNVVMLHYFEASGEVKQAISVFKKRGSAHERSIRSFSMSSKGIRIGGILRDYRGILSGLPAYSAGPEGEPVDGEDH